MKSVKYVVILLLLIPLGWLLILPIQPPNALHSPVDFPDYDFRTAAEELWSKDKKEDALTLLSTALSFNLPDNTAIQDSYDEYREQLEQRNSGLGKLKACGYAFATGRVNSFEELAGSSVADLFMYGDIRDLSRELVFENHMDPFIVSLSAAGLLTSIFPPADATVSILKSAKKSDALTAPLQAQLKKTLIPITKNSSKPSPNELKSIIDYLQPIYLLAKGSKTWKQFTLYLKHCENLKQIKFLNKILSKAGNSQKLSSILILLNKFPQQSKQALSYIRNFGQKGMDTLYEACRKGPKSLQFLLKNPGRKIKLSKNAVKTNSWLYLTLEAKWHKLKRTNGLLAELIRFGSMAVLIFLVSSLLKNKEKSNRTTPSLSKLNIILGLSGIILVFIFVSQASHTPEALSNTTKADLNSPSKFNLSSLLLLVAFSVAQLWSFLKVKSELKEISQEQSFQIKDRMLENAEFYFDLPIYIGLSGTVFSFILLTFDPSGSRIIAYATTITGILLSLYMRGFLLMPLKKQLVKKSE